MITYPLVITIMIQHSGVFVVVYSDDVLMCVTTSFGIQMHQCMV